MSPGLIVVAHIGAPLRPHDLWTAWSFEPVTILLLLGSAWLYLRGLRRLWHAAGTGRGVRRRDAVAFASGWTLLALGLLSPLHALGGVLFSAHMTQHELLMTVATPLLVSGRPLVPFIWALSPKWRRATGRWTSLRVVARPWRFLTHPASAFALHAIAIWVWHLPSLYDATVGSELVHAAQHASFVGTSLLFWWVVLQPSASRGGVAVSIAMLFGTVLHTGALGALLTLTSRLLYTAYAATTGLWGLSPVDDQQLGGIIMWVPGGLAYVVAALFLVVRLLRESEQRVARLEAAGLGGRESWEPPHSTGWETT
ncbi:MAG TPA: cytochrome c oxidase assembly protein [Gemmatimonadaceae bacterium]|nr:cytochrome c oxidase assembly protein [Gemmatimonadaceae bacterium]